MNTNGAYTVRIETTSGRTTNVGPFATRKAADEHVALFNTWAYVARIWVLPSADSGVNQ